MDIFTVKKNKSGARQGTLVTKRGSIATPFFMPDATRASVRGVTPEELKQVGLEALVVNTYHLFLQPGEELVSKSGGIHQFMDWDKLILSDSGGYQVYSLIHKHPEMGTITEEGAEFKSVLDGSKRLLTPERSIEIQFDLGVDMLVCLDDPRPNDVPDQEMTEAVERTLRWAKRCRDEYDKQVKERGLTPATRPLIFGVVQGGKVAELRKRCALGLAEIGFDGYGFGGRHVDEEGAFMEEILRHTASVIPEDSIRFALGIGTPSDIVRCFHLGWDIFDCVIPTREGRHGRLFVWEKAESRDLTPDTLDFYHTINIQNEQFREDFTSVDPSCDCLLCTRYTRAYLRHLFAAGEPLALRLASVHNLRFYMRLMEKLRA